VNRQREHAVREPDTEAKVRLLALLAWSAIAISTLAWTVHLVFTGIWVTVSGRGRAGSAVGGICDTGPTTPYHLATLVTALLALAALAMAAYVYRERDRVEPENPQLVSQLRFLGLIGVASALFNLVLILWEGSYVFFLGHCG
jgi:heme/copper-type cytochrome/quinol oxidase subunit 2